MTPSRIDRDTRVSMCRDMARIRCFQQRAYDLFMEGIVQGTTHLGLGQEAVTAESLPRWSRPT